MYEFAFVAMSDQNNNLTDQLLEGRNILIASEIDEQCAQAVIAQLLFLEHQDPNSPIYLYINSSGGLISESMAILDAMESIKPQVRTICVGQAAGTAALILASGERPHRTAIAAAKVNLVPLGFNNSKIEPQLLAQESERINRLISNRFALATGLYPHQIQLYLDNSTSLSGQEAVELGLIDRIISR